MILDMEILNEERSLNFLLKFLVFISNLLLPIYIYIYIQRYFAFRVRAVLRVLLISMTVLLISLNSKASPVAESCESYRF